MSSRSNDKGSSNEDSTSHPLHTKSRPITISTKYNEDHSRTMQAAQWYGTEDIRVNTVPAPDITDAGDAIVRITSCTICGSDLHMYFNQLPAPRGVGMQKGDIMGHESMGVVDKVGPDVKNIKVGQRVVISAPIACGQCEYCHDERYSLCDTTNPSTGMETLYGYRSAGIFGYSHLTGGIAGGQAEYTRVPFADINLLPVPDTVTDEQVLLLSDVICTGYHGTELAEVTIGSKVVVWGCGPVGLAAAYLSKLRGASIVISIDNDPTRLEKARSFGAQTINFDEVKSVTDEITQMIPGGPTNCIDCVGYRFPKSILSWVQMKLKMETDAVDVVKEMIISARKGAKLALIGDYFNYTNGFPIGAFMEKGQSMAGGQLWCQKYWRHLLRLIESGDLDMSFLFSHRFQFSDISTAYKTFAHHQDNCTKVFVKTPFGIEDEQRRRASTSSGSLNTAGQDWGKIHNTVKPPTSAKAIHLMNSDVAGGQDQLLKHVGTSGGLYSTAVQGGTMSNMGTSVAGSMLGAQGSQMGVGANLAGRQENESKRIS